jgi:CubicO group peptidase (beta-lactamase class C family)
MFSCFNNTHVLGSRPSHYGYFWWGEDVEVGGKTYRCKQGRGAGGQFIFIFPELDLIAVATAHNQGMGNTLETLPQKLIPAFVGR